MSTILFAAWLAGCIGNLAFGICYLPQVVKTYRNKTADGISPLLIILNLVGNLFGFIYLFSTDVVTGNWHYPIFANYIVAFLLNIILFYMKWTYRKGTMRSVNVHIHEYPFEVPNLTDGEHVHRNVMMISSIYAGKDNRRQIQGNGEIVPIFDTDFKREWGDNFVIWVYTDELFSRIMETRL